MKLTTIMFTLLMLVGCMANNPAMVKDEQHNFDTVSVTFVSTDNPETRFKNNNVTQGSIKKNNVNGATTFYVGKPACTIYAREPIHQFDKASFEILGHELWHCLRGRWHTPSNVTDRGEIQ